MERERIVSKVSVVITTYHREYSIVRKSILSALNQSYNNLETVLVDDNEESSQYTKSILEGIREFSNSIRYLSYSGNRGACFARNYGARNTEGKYLAFLDDDDIWYPDKIEKQVRVMENIDFSLVSCNSRFAICGGNGEVIDKIENIRSYQQEVSLQDILNANIPGGCSFPLILREAFSNVGGFNEELPSSQDYDLWIRMAKIGRIGHISDPLLDYYVYQTDRISKNVKAKIFSYTYLIKQYADLADNKAEFIFNKYLTLGEFCFEHNNIKEGIRFSLKALRENPREKNIPKVFSIIMYRICLIYKHRLCELLSN